MKYGSLISAVALVLAANAFVLFHAARNRSGEPDAEIVLTDRELTYYRAADDSGVALNLRWVDPGTPRYSASVKLEEAESRVWLTRSKLAELGFDCSVDPSAMIDDSFYTRQGARSVFVALEYDGAAWQKWFELELRIAQAEPAVPGQRNFADYQRNQSSRLAAIDAAADPVSLRARHPDRRRVLILPAVIRASVHLIPRPGNSRFLSGFIEEIPYVVHVPRPLSEGFRAPGRVLYRSDEREDPLYRVALRTGKLLEPWVTSVDFAKP